MTTEATEPSLVLLIGIPLLIAWAAPIVFARLAFAGQYATWRAKRRRAGRSAGWGTFFRLVGSGAIDARYRLARLLAGLALTVLLMLAAVDLMT